ncbi:uncharacterized protein LOC133699065 isoform X3 [Populus nigra]|uniref:uncharacterized protein LOC133699065 isoform X3 n=1 Tax=Populus nigra TaxID=3691 RepID=UPI002B26B3C0|nr:uncharacterized protein LOC133699065 isoform X3 [Populus nigra]
MKSLLIFFLSLSLSLFFPGFRKRERAKNFVAMAAVVMSYYCKPSPFLGHFPSYLAKSSSRQVAGTAVQESKISALFWGSKKSVQPKELDVSVSLQDSILTGGGLEKQITPKRISLSIISSISEVSSHEWDACNLDATGPDKFNPFLSHGFLSSLEESRSAVKSQVSSLHVTFPTEKEWHMLKEKGFLQRIGMQYHWKNRNYKNFDEFLMDMKQSKRKNIRQERKKVSTQNLSMKRLRGYEIKARHWDTFYSFYRNTTDNKWGTPYLTRDFFHTMGSKMGDQVLLVVAEEGDELVAGALNIIGGDTLFGRLWGCHPKAYYPSLHFEACYYQAIEAAIELNLNTVEAGAQGEHKIQRGYLPVLTYSCHYLIDEAFRKAIEEFLVRESTQVKLVMKLIHDSGPLKEGIK